MPSIKWPGTWLATLLLTACHGLPPSPRPGPSGAEAPAARPEAPLRRYQVDSAHSELRILVYRAGPLANLGHNHVIVDRALRGEIGVGAPMQHSQLRLQLTVADLLVDEPDARRQEGADFAEDVSEDARAGTRRNMLGADQLDADRHPLIDVVSVTIEGTEPAPCATLRVSVAGHSALLSLPFRHELSGSRLKVTADFDLRQTALGITPFSVMLGALRVEDHMRVKLDLVATAL